MGMAHRTHTNIWFQLAKMLIISPEFKCSNEILTIVAMLSGTFARRHRLRRFSDRILPDSAQHLDSSQ